MKLKKRKKSTRYHGRGRGTSGKGGRKNQRSSGNRGGKGMSGTGKRADHKKTLVNKLYGNNYFGKQGITSRKTQKKKNNVLNLGEIQENIENYIKKRIAEKTKNGVEINLKNYKILSKGEVTEKVIIKAKSASELAIKKIRSAGGEIIVKNKDNEEKKETKKKRE